MKFLQAVDDSLTRDLDAIADEWLERICEMFPETGSRLGFSQYEARLSENTPALHVAALKFTRSTLARVEALPEIAFHGDAWLDRRAFLAKLRTEALFSGELERWRTNPQVHCDTAVDAIFDLLVRAAPRIAKALPAVEARLAAIPDFLAAGAECVRRPVPLWVSLAGKSCEGAVEFLGGLEEELTRVSPTPDRTRSLLRSAARAFSTYADAIARKRPGPAEGCSIGRERFEFLIRERLGLNLSLPEARACGERLVAEQEYLLERAAARFGNRPARELLERTAAEWTPESSLLTTYRRATAKIRRDLASLGIVTLPKGESLKVLPVPAFLRHQFPTAAYSGPPPFAKKQTGIFWVNDLSLTRDSESSRLAEIRQHFGLELTSVHEGYPGHHLQFVVQYRHPSRIRRLCEHAIFYEGWTMWCEKLAVERGLVEFPLMQLTQLHDALWRAHRIVIDCGLHDGSLSPEKAARRLVDGVGFTAARAMGDVNWYTSSPTVPMSYLLGRLEVEKLHRCLVAGEGWSLIRFNDWLLSHGAVPPSWIWQARRNA